MTSRYEEAFPHTCTDADYVAPGLTKREWMAAIILQGLAANPEYYKKQSRHIYGREREDITSQAIKMADALIDELAADDE